MRLALSRLVQRHMQIDQALLNDQSVCRSPRCKPKSLVRFDPQLWPNHRSQPQSGNTKEPESSNPTNRLNVKRFAKTFLVSVTSTQWAHQRVEGSRPRMWFRGFSQRAGISVLEVLRRNSLRTLSSYGARLPAHFSSEASMISCRYRRGLVPVHSRKARVKARVSE